MTHQCRYCEKTFQRENSLAVHVCEPKRRFQEQDETGVRLGLQAYLRFYEITQGSAKLKTFDDFARSPYYRAFVKFGRYCVDIHAINVPRFTDWLINHNKKIDHWYKDSMYGEYLAHYLRVEHVEDAIKRAQEHALQWSEATGNPARDYLRFGNINAVCFAVTTGRISSWILYNTDSGNEFLANLQHEHVSLIWNMIDSDFWQRKFREYPADTEYVRQIMSQQGW